MRVNAIHGDAVGTVHLVLIVDRQQGADFADLRVPAVAVQSVGRGFALAHQDARGVIGRERDQLAFLVEWLTGSQIDRAADAAFDHLGVRILVDVHAGHQVGGDVREAQCLAVRRGKGIPPVNQSLDPR